MSRLSYAHIQQGNSIVAVGYEVSDEAVNETVFEVIDIALDAFTTIHGKDLPEPLTIQASCLPREQPTTVAVDA